MTSRVRLFIVLAAAAIAFVALLKLAVLPLLGSTNEEHYRYVIGVSQPNLSDPWLVAMNEEVRAEVRKHSNLQVIFTDAAQNSQQQRADVEKLVSYGIDLLIISLDDPMALTETISEVYAKIPVIVLGRGVTDYDYTLYIGTDNEMIGRKAGEFAAELLKEQEREGRIIELQGVDDSPTVEERSEGFESALDGSGFETIERFHADWQRDKAEDLLLSWFNRQQDGVDLIFAHNEAMAIGAFQAVKRAGLTDIDIIGIDGVNTTSSSRQLVADNKLTATFTSPTGGKEAIRYAIDILNKEKGIPKKVILRSEKVTAESETGGEENAMAGAAGGEDSGSNEGIDSDYVPGNISGIKDRNEKPIVLGFAQVGTESGWRIAHTNSVMSAAQNAGIQLLYENAEQSQERQVEIIREFIRKKVDVIAFSPKTETGWDEVLQEAKEAGIPVILSDREVKAADDTLWTSYIGSDFRDEGRRAASWLLGEAEPDRSYNIIELQGTPDSAPAIGRKRGFDEGIAGDERFRLIASYEGDFTRGKGKELMERALRTYGGDIHVVYAHNDDMALGAIQAIENYGLKPGKDIILISVDATKAALKAISIGKLNLAVECSPLLGPQLMKAVKDLLGGQELPMKIITSEGMFTQSLAKKVLASRDY
ncbi:simple sugar transport system substrate-binding protein [Paenibacillus phyllosphaerae]|uniref:Simple sugar transport system substrate-binding protein n=1 Tax=Paenibacillus phyllosphaerae TaxID=274593 RepID=A0A7W5AT59_9BACL|nr:substrate-binding domain-containing protein [Paenibacillus phyllosphaerae]MBB3108187.1 simple sugar transport system substrate-binding protein [Paenibacillus phyllosphaerae]